MVSSRRLRLFKLIMQLQGLIDLRHELFWEMSKLFDKADLVYSPCLIDHDFRTGSQASRAWRYFHFERIDALYI